MAPKSKTSQSTIKKQLPAEKDDQSKPAWPALSPSIPVDDLTFHVLLPDQILTIGNLWSSNLCKKYTNFLATLPLTTTPSKAKRGDAVRVNDRFQINDAAYAARLWTQTALKQMLEHPVINGERLDDAQTSALWGGELLGLNANVRVYRYKMGQFFDKHYDESNNVDFITAEGTAIPAKTTWTLLLYLSSPTTGCQGGETVFYPEAKSKREPTPAPVVADLEVGTVLLHRHGADCLLHEGREVTAGEKWVIRSDICVRR
ncbi:hypothetical protein AMS68_006395 [Peltaster fructicola]|uniref:Prolyl 4-hydroxylase alpha subunit domain-containing protein n=1 Tax=Peltaster fructicola TaxID=286661 RepID=A0A6H0Y207_9PEZI|nr:hypothetical protein AMS68_006395 [Peltaster fructicola]